MMPTFWHHPVMRQWSGMLVALLIATILLCQFHVFWRADFAVYDAALQGAAAPSDVVIVAVDDASVEVLGRWPWRRDIHAALLDRLREAGARAVAMDVLFTEPSTSFPAADTALSAAMNRGLPVVLPLLVEMPSQGKPLQVHLPIPVLAQVAARIGHAHLELDRDGVGRSVFLREGIGAPTYSHLALALLESLHDEATLRLPGTRHPDLAGAPQVWVRDYHMLIPFLGPPGHFNQVSYIDVLRGNVPVEAIRNKLVLVGATAQGTGDAYPTPTSGEGVAMPGVEVTANVLQALRSGHITQPVSALTNVVLSLLPILIVALGFLRFSPRRSLLLVLVIWVLTVGASVISLRHLGWWWSPVVSSVILMLMYPLWSWRRLEATQVYLEEEFQRLVSEPVPFLGNSKQIMGVPRFVDVVQKRIDFVRQATQRSREVRRLLANTINSLPDATLLVDIDGRIILSNHAAAKLFGVDSLVALEGLSVDTQLFQRTGAEQLRFTTLAASAPGTVEISLPDSDRVVLIRTVPFLDYSNVRVGTVIDLTDITELRSAQREREDVLRFLSHDMKSPASSLLGLAQLQRDPQRALPPLELSQRLDLLAQRTLALVDSFVALARAELADPRVFDEFNLRDAVQDACDEVWAIAESHSITICTNLSGDMPAIRGDRSLIARAIVNLLGNAVKFSPSKTSVQISCTYNDNNVIVSIADEGPGISVETKGELFQRFSRRKHRGQHDPGGAGLGLAFVRVVVEKHGGRVWVTNNIEQGVTFYFSIPISNVSN